MVRCCRISFTEAQSGGDGGNRLSIIIIGICFYPNIVPLSLLSALVFDNGPTVDILSAMNYLLAGIRQIVLGRN